MRTADPGSGGDASLAGPWEPGSPATPVPLSVDRRTHGTRTASRSARPGSKPTELIERFQRASGRRVKSVPPSPDREIATDAEVPTAARVVRQGQPPPIDSREIDSWLWAEAARRLYLIPGRIGERIVLSDLATVFEILPPTLCTDVSLPETEVSLVIENASGT